MAAGRVGSGVEGTEGAAAMTDLQRFYEHIEHCEACDTQGEPLTMCAIGRELLYEAGEALPEAWQQELARILRKEELQREADENFRFYAASEEP